MKFRFANGDDVVLRANGRRGVVVARAEHLGGELKYLVQPGGGLSSSWANEDALELAPAEPSAPVPAKK